VLWRMATIFGPNTWMVQWGCNLRQIEAKAAAEVGSPIPQRAVTTRTGRAIDCR
jgi:hypothetical protein